QAQVLPPDERLGIVMLKIDPGEVEGGLHPVWPVTRDGAGDGPYFRTGQFVVSLGNCFRLAEFSEKVSATFGVVVGRANTALRYRLADVKFEGDLILTDACNNQGQYGGGLFDLQGNWIGLNTRLIESKETNTMLSAAIPSRDLLPYLDECVRGVVRDEKQVANKPVYIGAVLFQQAGRQSPPAYVDRVIADSPAAKAGLRPDDLIVRIDEFSVRSCKELREVLAKFKPGQTVQVTYKRGTKVVQAPLVLEEEKQGCAPVPPRPVSPPPSCSPRRQPRSAPSIRTNSPSSSPCSSARSRRRPRSWSRSRRSAARARCSPVTRAATRRRGRSRRAGRQGAHRSRTRA